MPKRSSKTVYASPDPRRRVDGEAAFYDEPDIAPEPGTRKPAEGRRKGAAPTRVGRGAKKASAAKVAAPRRRKKR